MLVPGLIAIGAVMGYRYYKKMQRTQTNLEVIPHAKIYGLSGGNITLQLDINLKNPSAGDFEITYPHVSVSYDDSVIASSRVIDKRLPIPAHNEIWINKMMLDIPVLQLATSAWSIFQSLSKGKSVTIKVKTVTDIHLSSVTIPYDDEKEIPVSKGKTK